VFRNEAPRAGHWLRVRARDEALHRDAIGARVSVIAGPLRLTRLVHPGGSYLSSSDVRLHFGLGAAERFDAVEIVWPGGRRERFVGGAADRTLDLVRGTGDEIR
jgi:hypothetical protein